MTSYKKVIKQVTNKLTKGASVLSYIIFIPPLDLYSPFSYLPPLFIKQTLLL